MKILRPPAAPPARPTARGSFRLGSAPMKREPVQVKRRKKSTCRKSIVILNSADHEITPRVGLPRCALPRAKKRRTTKHRILEKASL